MVSIVAPAGLTIPKTSSRAITSPAGTADTDVTVHMSDGLQPVGRGIGPALEARDMLAVLQGRPEAPLFTVHAEDHGELDYALAYARRQPDIIRLDAARD